MTLDLKLVRRRLFDEQASSHDEQIIETAISSVLSDRHTAMPGIIDSFDAAKQTATVRPALKQPYLPDSQIGDPEWMEIKLLVDVPVVFPATANYALTFPVAQGDECLLIFSERPIDVWQTKGDVQEFDDMRTQDYSDAIAIIGLRSQPNKLSNYDADHVQLRSTDGTTVITLDDKGIVTLKAISIILEGKVNIIGPLSGTMGATFTGDIIGAGTQLSQHIHSGVAGGIENTEPPVPGTE